jgi:hypothetical protein
MSKGGIRAALPGTVAHSAVEHLRTLPVGTELSSHALASAIGQYTEGFGRFLAPSLRAGLLARRKAAGIALWSLGSNADAAIHPPEPTLDEEDRATVRRVSAKAVPSVFAYGEQRGAAAFSVAISTDGRLTVERHGRVVLELNDDERRQLLDAAANGVRP